MNLKNFKKTIACGGMSLDIHLIESKIEKLDSVTSCKIILGEEDEFEEIHIVSNGSRAAKQIIRDIESILTATYKIQINHKKISIAEIQDGNLKKIKSRLKLLSISHESKGEKVEIKISLANKDDIYENTIIGINTMRNIERMLVDLTLRTIEDAYGYDESFVLEDIKTVDLSVDRAIVVVIACVRDGYTRRFSGSSIIGSDYKEAAVKATLDALNRYTTY